MTSPQVGIMSWFFLSLFFYKGKFMKKYLLMIALISLFGALQATSEDSVEIFTKEMKKIVNNLEEVVGGMGFNYANVSEAACYARKGADIEGVSHETAKAITIDLLMKRVEKDRKKGWIDADEKAKKKIFREVRHTVADAFDEEEDNQENEE